jgi:hypothetical protein
VHVPDAAAKFTCEGVYHGAAAAAAAAVTSGPTHTVSERTSVKMNDIVETKSLACCLRVLSSDGHDNA